MNDFEKDRNEELETEELVTVTTESEAEEVTEAPEAAETVEEAPETEEAPKRQYAGHMTASAAALNAAGEVDIS